MALVVTSSTSSPPPVESRGQAIARVVAEREAAARASTSEQKQTDAGTTGTQDVPNTTAEPAKPADPTADPRVQVELERRERALDQRAREVEDLRRELEAAKGQQADLKDWRKALELGGHKIEDVVQEWLGGEPTKPTAPAAPPAGGADRELLQRLERLEQKEQQELRGRARLERRAAIAAMMPADSDDFEAMRTLGDGALDTFLERLEAQEKTRPQGIGPAELAHLLRDFEGNTRKNLESEFTRLAKSKWVKQTMRKLLESNLETPPGPESTATSSDAGPESIGHRDTNHGDSRSHKPAGLSREELIARARAAIVAKMR